MTPSRPLRSIGSKYSAGVAVEWSMKVDMRIQGSSSAVDDAAAGVTGKLADEEAAAGEDDDGMPAASGVWSTATGAAVGVERVCERGLREALIDAPGESEEEEAKAGVGAAAAAAELLFEERDRREFEYERKAAERRGRRGVDSAAADIISKQETKKEHDKLRQYLWKQ